MVHTQHTQLNVRETGTEPETSVRSLRNVIHTVLLDRDKNVLGCIDQLDKNAQLIRLDGGLHWSVTHSVENSDRTTSKPIPK